MEDLRRCLERQERETNERSSRRVKRQRLQREENEQFVIQWLCLMKRTKVAALVHKSAVARMWTDIGILGVDEIAPMGKSTTLEALVRFCDEVETLYTRDYLRRPTSRDL
ncbi:hypothetical protein L3X38_027301 [Prunus dulcis]|uniref:Uncharacterized protein n=1 Tax=Prunus dulcis TaxID=3755 RepID=A0AAD4VMM6_PRUDU|nr:hypothetical protein L3X38_027301 [Prunus dulcis]